MKTGVAIIGCGTVGTALARLLGRAGYPIEGVSSRNPGRAAAVAQNVGATHASAAPWEVTGGAGLVFITTPDDAIQPTCEALASRHAFTAQSVVVHCSGTHPSTILESARRCGAAIASVHPLQSFATAEDAEALVPGSYFGIEGDAAAMPLARRLVTDLGGVGLEITPTLKTLYHAGAVAASNYLVVLLHMALEFSRLAGIPPETAFQALTPLVQGTLTNVGTQGIPGALTGPIARGDVATVTGHLASIKEHLPAFSTLYADLAGHAIRLALEKGTISKESARRLQEVLQSE